MAFVSGRNLPKRPLIPTSFAKLAGSNNFVSSSGRITSVPHGPRPSTAARTGAKLTFKTSMKTSADSKPNRDGVTRVRSYPSNAVFLANGFTKSFLRAVSRKNVIGVEEFRMKRVLPAGSRTFEVNDDI